jgi:type IV pilus assembly protein PilV
MEPAVYSSNSASGDRGFTLIEFLVAILILMVGLLAILQTATTAIVHSMTTQLRNEAVVLADEQMSQEKVKVFDAISSAAPPGKISRSVASRTVYGAFRNYSVTRTNTTATSYTKNITISVSWQYKGTRYAHSIASLVSQNQ